MIGSLLSLPYILLFFATWIVSSLLRPAVTVSLACVLCNPVAAIRKAELFTSTVLYLALCNDKSWKKPQDPGAIFEPILTNPTENAKVEKKTLIFVRQ